MHDVTVIGAGVAGLWAALALSRAGARVRLIDRAGGPGPGGCSWWAGGMLAPFCEGATAEPAITAHGRAAAADWAGITPVTARGTLVVAPARDRGELARFARRTSDHVALTRAAEVEPDLPDAGPALFFPTEGHLHPRRALADLVAALAERGVVIEQASVDPRDVAGPVVDTRGMAADLPGLRGVRGEMVLLRAPDITLTRPVRLLHPRHPLYVVPRGDGVYMLGATQIESMDRRAITARSLLELLGAAHALDPRLSEGEVLETGADLRPALADNVPRVIRRGRVVHVNGLFRHGYLMAPALARQAADYLIHGIKGDLFHED